MSMHSATHSEARIQADCVCWFKVTHQRYQDLLYMNNNNSIGAKRGNLAKAMGLTAGIPDCFLALFRGAYHGFYIEFKKPGEGLTATQLGIKLQLCGLGFHYSIIKSLEQFQQEVELYLNLPSHNL